MEEKIIPLRFIISIWLGLPSLVLTIFSSVIVCIYNIKSEPFWVWDCFVAVYFGSTLLSCLYLYVPNNEIAYLFISLILVFYNIILIIVGIVLFVNGKANTLPCENNNIISYCDENKLRELSKVFFGVIVTFLVLQLMYIYLIYRIYTLIEASNRNITS